MDKYTIKIIVATQNICGISDDMYLKLQVGAKDHESIGYQRDDEGENISELNSYYSELTGLYWAWKNLKEDYIGLVHYRRAFELKGHLLEKKDIEPYLGKIKVFVPQKRWYVIETLKSHYNHTHYPEHLDVTKSAVEKLCPEYLEAFEKTLNRRFGYMFNMMIMERTLLNEYCAWLFPILDIVFSKVDSSEYTEFEKRFVGRMSEILFNVWLEYKKKCGDLKKSEIMELDCNLEENWKVKIPAFLKAKFFGKKYGGSF